LCKRTKEYDLTDESQVNFPFKIKKMMLGSDINEIIGIDNLRDIKLDQILNGKD
jgi:hypothetical protein